MKLIFVLLAVTSLLLRNADAADDDERIASLKMDSAWTELALSTDLRRDNWSLRIFRNVERDEMLTFACYRLGGRPLTFDEAWEFAPSGYPFWAPQSTPYSINPINSEWLEPEKYGKRNRLKFTVVNDHDSGLIRNNLMANGFVANLNDRIYFVQHTSKHPITDSQVKIAFQLLLKTPVAMD
ncbi:MAG: hypothetical protein R3C18_20700 [Planctomycetaceae bacterium]